MTFNNPNIFADPTGLWETRNGQMVGADGLTNSEWAKASNPLNSGNRNSIETNFRKQGTDQSQGFKYPNGTWDFNAEGKTEDEMFRIYEGNKSHVFYRSFFGQKRKNEPSAFDLINGIAGNFLSALDSYSSSNATKKYNYGTRTISAAALTEANAARMIGISRMAQGVGGALAIGTGVYTLSSEYYSARATGSYDKQAVLDGSVGIVGGVSGSIVLAAEIGVLVLSPVIVPVLTTVAIGATVYGVYTLGRDMYNASH